MGPYIHQYLYLYLKDDFVFMANDAPRPILITIIAIIQFLIGLAAVFAGIVLLAGILTVSDIPEMAQMGAIGGAGMLIVGLIYLVIAGGFWNGWKIMWYIGVIVHTISILLSIYTVATGAGIMSYAISIIISLVILLYLFTRGVREFFGVA